MSDISIKRISAYFFLSLMVVPVILFFLMVGTIIFLNLNQIKQTTEILTKDNVPTILATQRAITNISLLRLKAEVIYSSSDLNNRQQALLDAEVLIADAMFETYYGFIEDAKVVRDLMVKLSELKTKRETAEDELHRAELNLHVVIPTIYSEIGVEFKMRTTHNARHKVPIDKLEYIKNIGYGLSRMKEAVEVCTQQDLVPVLEESCSTFKVEWERLEKNVLSTVECDLASLEIWTKLDALLSEMRDSVSMGEVQRVYSEMETINTEVDLVYIITILCGVVLIGIFLIFVILFSKYILIPLKLAVQTLHQIQNNLPATPLPLVRISELYELFNLIPLIHKSVSDLRLHSGYLEQQNKHYANLSFKDALTGLENRRSLDLYLLENTPKIRLAVLMLDVDFFKLYNDSIGHQAGDTCLINVAKALHKSIRFTDHLYRYGGEEFLIILHDVSVEDAYNIAQDILNTVRKLQIPHPAFTDTCVTISIGIAAYKSSEQLTYEALLFQADQALYQAKERGRNRAWVYVAEDEPVIS